VKVRWLLYVLLLAIPLTIGAWYLNRTGTYAGQLTFWIFGLALVAVIPLAALLGRLTETLEDYLGERVGGLLGASFGNVPELAIGVALLIHAHIHAGNQVTVASDLIIIRGLLIGSVVNNVLFTLGSSIFFGATRNGRMRFSADSASGYASMLALAVVGLALPTIALSVGSFSTDEKDLTAIQITVPFAIVLILSYAAYLLATIFKVGSRPSARALAEERKEHEGSAKAAPQAGKPAVTIDGATVLADDASNLTEVERVVKAEEAQEQDDDAEERRQRAALRRAHPYTVPIALVGLAAVTVATVIIAGLLVSVTDNVIFESPLLTPLSVGFILFPIVCNLGEQAGAMASAWRNKMEGAMSVAAGSSVQVALFVTPVLALISFLIATGDPHLILSLTFQPLALIVIGLVSFVYALVSLDGETTWLEGLQLLAFYLMIAAVAFALPGA
jgi:Ca2+:H+ antiporter